MHISSCAILPQTPESLTKNIEAWLAENQYDNIFNALDKVDNNNPEYKQALSRRPMIQKQHDAYIEKTISTANTYKARNQWQQALVTYNTALENIEKHPKLTAAKQQLLLERSEQVTELRKELLLKQANALVSYKKIYTKLHQLIPEDYSAQFDINRFEKDRLEVAGHLEKCGEQARKSNQLILARDCYSLSNQLEPSKVKLSWVNKIESRLKNSADKQRHKELLAAYNSSYKKKEYNKARMHLNTLLAIDPKHKKAAGYLKKLDKEINKQVISKIGLGKDLYSQKKINEALKIWIQAQQLQPDNEELAQLISRAEKVSKKIESLEHNQ